MNDDPTTPVKGYFPPRGEALGVLLLTFFVFLIVGLIGEGALGKTQILLGEASILLPAYIYLRWRNYEPMKVFRVRTVGWRILAISVVIGLSMTIVADELDRLMSLLLPFPEELAAILRELLIARSPYEWAIIVVGAVLFAGLFEEMLFRGFLQNSLEQYGDVTRAVLWTALWFAAFHVNPWWLAQIILLGVILGVMSWKSNSILPGAIVHAINNGISVAVVNAGEDKFKVLEWHDHVHPLLLAAALAALIFSLRLFYKFCEQEEEIPSQYTTS